MHLLLTPWSSAYTDPFQELVNLFTFTPAPASATTPQRHGAGGAFQRAQLHTEGGVLAYKLFIPSSWNGAPLPLLLMLHGCGQDADDFARGTGMNALADALSCIVVYPEQSSSANSARCWNWYDDAHHHRDCGEPAMLAALTRQVMEEYKVEPGKVFVAGLSAGGAMAVVLGRTYPELYSAVGCHSGLAYACATDMAAAIGAMRDGPSAHCSAFGHANAHLGAAAHVPVIVFHGDQDNTVHPRNGAHIVEQSLAQCALKAAGVDGNMAAIALQAERGETTGRRYTRQVYQDAAGAVLAEQWLVHGAGHAWSGGSRSGSYTDASGPSASAEMLRFFLALGAR